MNKKQEKEMLKWFADYFSNVILDICQLKSYKITVIYEEQEADSEDEEKTFSIKSHYPYNQITLFVRKGGRQLYEEKDFNYIRLYLLHEAWHIIDWQFNELAHSRYVEPIYIENEREMVAEKFSFIVNNLYKQIK